MKKLAIILTLTIICLMMFGYKYFNFKSEYSQIKRRNAEYESYYQKVLYGSDIATIVNRAVNDNERNDVKKDSKGLYIDNNTNSLKVEVKITDNDTLYTMEKLYDGGMTNFVTFYQDVEFECTKIEYHQSTRNIKYMLFEQKSE